MAKYRVQIDPPMPDRERIAASRDFDSLYKQYQTQSRFEFWRNIYRKPRNFAILVMVIAVGALVIESNQDEMRPTFRVQPLDTVVFSPPTLETLTLSAMDQQVVSIRTSGDASLIIPAFAWQDSAGNKIVDSVRLYVQLVSGAKEWFQAGLPRSDTGILRQLNALNVYALQDGKRLRLRPEKPIQVKWFLDEKPEDIAFYRLDSTQENWAPIADAQWKGHAGVLYEGPISSLPEPVKPNLAAPIASALPSKPPLPFGIELKNPQAYPEFASYKQTFWAYVDQPGSVNPWDAGLIDAEDPWDDIRVEKKGNGLYELKFSRAAQSTGRMQIQRVLARPILQAKSKAEANHLYQQQLTAWRTEVAQIEFQDSLLRQTYEAALQAYEDSLAQWNALQQGAVSPVTSGFFSYYLTELTASGYWSQQVGDFPMREVEWKAEEMAELAYWLPWCYAVGEEQVYPLEVKNGNIWVPEEAKQVWLRADTLVRLLDLTTLP